MTTQQKPHPRLTRMDLTLILTARALVCHMESRPSVFVLRQNPPGVWKSRTQHAKTAVGINKTAVFLSLPLSRQDTA